MMSIANLFINKAKTTHVYYLLLVFCLTLKACVHVPDYLQLTKQQPIIPEKILMLNPPANPVLIDDFLAITPEMKEFIKSLKLAGLSPSEKVNKIYDTLFYQNGYIIDYDMFTTLNAGETFKQKRGNCMSLTAMMVALGRAAGLKAQFQEVNDKKAWYSQNGIFTKLSHVNTLMFRNSRISIVVDFYDKYYFTNTNSSRVSDQLASAFYLNNLASEALVNNQLDYAYYYYKLALNLAPDQSDIWNNIGTVLSPLKQYELAESIFQYAIFLDPKNYSVLINLRGLYLNTNRYQLAETIKQSVDQLYADNPHYIKSLAERALIAGDVDKAIEYIKQANELSPNLIDPSNIYVYKEQQKLHYQFAQHKFE